MKIGAKLKRARETLGLSQEQVSQLIPMNQSSYSKLERDMQEPSLDQLRALCRILQLDPAYLLSLGTFENATEKELLFAREVMKLYQQILTSK